MGWNGRRGQCAIPECPQGDEVFPTILVGNAHLREVHGLQFWTGDEGLVMLDPPSAKLVGRRGSSKDFCPTGEEFDRLVAAARDEMDRVVFLTLGEAGLRSGELRALRPSWLRDGTLHVPYRDPETGWTAKTKRAARAIPLREMSPEAWEVLQHAELPVGISSVTVWQRVRKGGLRADLAKHLRPHSLRSYCATVWAYRLSNPFTLMALMGWSDLRTAIVYVQTSGRAVEDAVAAWNHNGHNGGSVPSGSRVLA